MTQRKPELKFSKSQEDLSQNGGSGHQKKVSFANQVSMEERPTVKLEMNFLNKAGGSGQQTIAHSEDDFEVHLFNQENSIQMTTPPKEQSKSFMVKRTSQIDENSRRPSLIKEESSIDG